MRCRYGQRQPLPEREQEGYALLPSDRADAPDTASNFDIGLSSTYSQRGFRASSGRAKDIFHFHRNGLAIESEMLPDAADGGLLIQDVEIGVLVQGKALHDM